MADFEVYQQADIERTKLRASLLETFLEKVDNLKELAKKTLTRLQSHIIRDIEKEGKVTLETEQLFNNITDIISTAGSRKGIEVLRRARAYLRSALYPSYPYDFPQPRRIKERFKTYRDSFEYAVQQHVLVWEQWLMKGTRESYKQSIKDIKNITDKLNQARSNRQVETID
jgi:hypothetical protein